MSRKIQSNKPSESTDDRLLPAIASMKFWSRFKNPPPLLAFTFPEPADDPEQSLDRLTRLPDASTEQSLLYSLKISLDGAKPPIWRRVIVGESSLEVLHHTIQIVMGWCDSHLHGFEVRKIRVPLVEDGAEIDERQISISQLHSAKIKKFKYLYDFGDQWRHTIEIEEALPVPPNVSLPACVAGKGICPIEDVGGMWHWAKLLEAIQNPAGNHNEDIDALLDRVGENYDPAPFDLEETNTRLQRTFHKRLRRKGRA